MQSRALSALAGAVSVLLLSSLAAAQDVDVPGNLTMVDSTATEGNILKAGVPFIHNFGTNNTFVGSYAGNLLMKGAGNTALGFNALQSNSNASFGTAIGESALANNTTGNENTAIGDSALYSNTTGFFNTATGSGALYNNATGALNTATGAGALYSNITGGSNTATGYQALQANTSGVANTATGHAALARNTSGDFNTGLGLNTLGNNTTGSNNTAVGYLAMQGSFAGNNNTALGYQALQANIGNNNTALGFNTGVSPINVFNATVIGAGAVVNASNKIRLGNTQITVIEGQVGFTASSDRAKKENLRPIDGEQVLGKIRGFKLTSWNFIGQDPKRFRHYGPMAQDFFAAFGDDGVGTIGTPTTITSTDMEGILMVAAQALEKRSVKQEKELAVLKAENADLKARLEALERRAGYALSKAD